MTSANDVLMGDDPFMNSGRPIAVPRTKDRSKRPRIIPPGGGKPVSYSRTTRFVSPLEDTYNLGLYELRQAAIGFAERPDLLFSVGAHRDDRNKLNELCAEAKKAAKADSAAIIGTALHRYCERLDRGEVLGRVPEIYRNDIEEYRRITRNMESVHIERFMVNDDLKVGGTPDQVVRYKGRTPDGVYHDDELFIADIKSGKVKYGTGKIAMQLAVYAHSQLYQHVPGEWSAEDYARMASADATQAEQDALLDPFAAPGVTCTREPIPDINQEWGIVIHLPAGKGKASLHWSKIGVAWRVGIELVQQVQEWRKEKGLLVPFADNEALDVADGFSPIPDEDMASNGVERLNDHAFVFDLIRDATTEAELGAIWRAHRSVWTPKLTALAKARKEQIRLMESMFSGEFDHS